MKKSLLITSFAVFVFLGAASASAWNSPVFFNNGGFFGGNNIPFVNPNGPFFAPNPLPQPFPNPNVPFIPNNNVPFVPNVPFVAPNPIAPVPNGPFVNPNFNPNNPFINPGPQALPIPQPFPQPAPQPNPVPVPNPAPQFAFVIITNNGVLQNPLNIPAGTLVIWRNKTGVPGRIMDPNGVFTSGIIPAGGAHVFKFNNVGNFKYFFNSVNGNLNLNALVNVQ